MTPKVPTSESGTATLGISVARALRRNTNTTSTTSADAEHQRELDVVHRGADGLRAIERDLDVDRRRDRLRRARAGAP